MADARPDVEEVSRRPRESAPAAVDALQRNVNALLDRVSELERFKAEQAQFVFQTVAIVITLLALTIGVPVAVVTRLQVGSGLATDVIAGALTGILLVLGAWLILWHRVHFRGRRPTRRR